MGPTENVDASRTPRGTPNAPSHTTAVPSEEQETGCGPHVVEMDRTEDAWARGRVWMWRSSSSYT